MIVQLLTADIPNKNGHIYSKECIEEMIAKGGNSPLFLTSKPSMSIEPLFEDVIGTVSNLHINDNNNTLEGKIEFLQLSHCKQFKDLVEHNELSVRHSLIANLSDEGIVSDASLNYFFLTNDPA